MPAAINHEDHAKFIKNKFNDNIFIPSKNGTNKYNGNHSNLIYRCRHHKFEWTTKPILIKYTLYGCPKCYAGPSFEDRLKEKFEHVLIVNKPSNIFKNWNDHLYFYCNKHNFEWQTSPRSLMQSPYGCPKCGSARINDHKRIPHKIFKQKVKVVNPHIKVLSRFKGVDYKIKCKCKKCGKIAKRTAGNLLTKQKNCKFCVKRHKSHKKYIKELELFTKIIPVEKYIRDDVHIKHKCHCGNIWKSKPNNILAYKVKRCPKCSMNKGRYSYAAIEWLNIIAARENINIQHAANGSELHIKLPNKRWIRCDGYCRKNNTIYEFYGDVFHGNPSLYSYKCQCHPYYKTTARKLYEKTIKREKIIKKLGYNLVTMWENDFNFLKKSGIYEINNGKSRSFSR